MTNAAEILRKKLSAEIESGKISKTELCRKTGFSRSLLDAYLKGTTTPGLDAIQRAAEAIGKEPWQLLGPDEPPAVEALTILLDKQEARIKELEAKLAGRTGVAPNVECDEILSRVASLGPNGRRRLALLIDILEEADASHPSGAAKRKKS